MQHRKRCKRWDVPYGVHCLTFSTYQRRPFLNRDRCRQWVVEGIARARERLGFHLWAWVIMPEHVHLVVWVREGIGISDILKSIKSSVARRALYWAERHAPDSLRLFEYVNGNGQVEHRFWQAGGGYERLITEGMVY